ncbi:MAG: glycoside hydrolase family 36 protein [Bacteroidota bacterium]
MSINTAAVLAPVLHSEASSQFDIQLELIQSENGLDIYRLRMQAEVPTPTQSFQLKWRLPAQNIKGVWKTSSLYEKRLQYDWELEHLKSRISIEAPIICLFGHDDSNRLTFACSDAVNTLQLNALLREEDSHVYCFIDFFSEEHPPIQYYEAEIRIDQRTCPYYESIQDVAHWWASYEHLRPAKVPDIARQPLYSTWYQYHQNLDPDTIVADCQVARQLGYEIIIIDDGWQTLDNNRGYDYTGDWQPERIPDMAGFVKRIHQTGMKVGLWFSVPFCGKHSRAYQRFKGKFLTENHRWAPVFDPRYPEVRQHLIDIYCHALKQWNLDGFKLDFIDDFDVYPETVLTKADGRDYASVNAAVDRLMTDVYQSLKAIKPNIFIEFRQRYIGPAMRKFGNMLRAFDCPNDSSSNRIRTTDVKLLCGQTAIHSDPLIWHRDEAVEVAAFQLLNGLFGVPQLSVEIQNMPADHLAMIQFLNQYWKDHRHILLDGDFRAFNPQANYPLLLSQKDNHQIISIGQDQVIPLGDKLITDIFNVKMSDQVVIRTADALNVQLQIWDCMGNEQLKQRVSWSKGLVEIALPVSGLLRIRRSPH